MDSFALAYPIEAQMVWFVVAQVFTLALDIPALQRQSEHEKAIEILLLRQQCQDRRDLIAVPAISPSEYRRAYGRLSAPPFENARLVLSRLEYVVAVGPGSF